MNKPFVVAARVSCLLLLLASLSCKKLLSVPAPQNETLAAAVFDNDADAQTSLRGLYVKMMDNPGGPVNSQISLCAGLSSDELASTAPHLLQDSFYYNQLSASNGLCNSLYTQTYYFLLIANSALTGIAASTGMSDTMKAELGGEAEFNRAFLYFYLVNLYGDVPLVLSPDFTQSSVLPRTPAAQVYSQIEADLEDAQKALPLAYMTTSDAPNDRTRPNQRAASALLARVWLYQGQWLKAEAAADSVIADGRYQLEPDLDKVFLSSSREAIWQLQPVHGTIATADASWFVPVVESIKPVYVLTDTLLNSYEPGDQRLSHWTAAVTLGGIRYVYPFKYKQTTYQPASPEYEMVLRLAEVYLIRAEARAQQGNLIGAVADLNILRQRAGLPVLSLTDQTAALAAIQHERQIELSTEWGHRWLDLKRTGQVDTVLQDKKNGWETSDALYPLPGQDLRTNPNLIQNPGYH
jgi:starch-binding outer membrane protein, SusD/RagB family